ncbi:hypothetical protein B7Y94_00865 [Candidatus Saccharibacteria bacterium 32-49-12]|nr:MAG: hypothetical protein B7Y94_00865 [Candidatus Saccharibacteria bacterium 32-49-12]
MCRGKKYCTELGNNPSQWDRDCPLRLPSVYDSAIDTFVDTVRLFAGGQRDQCIRLLETIDSASITDWYIEHGQQSGLHRNRIISLKLGAPLPIKDRYPVRSPARLQDAVFERDGYRCRYCGNRLIDQRLLRGFAKALGSPIFTRGTTNLTSHAIIHIAWPVADHVVPWSRGGETAMGNLVASCAPCNYGKADFTIEQIGISNPLDRLPVMDGWDGLRSLTVAL